MQLAFDPSGHAFLSIAAAGAQSESSSGESALTKVYTLAWTLEICLIQVVTTFKYHTVTEMLSGMALIVPFAMLLKAVTQIDLKTPWGRHKDILVSVLLRCFDARTKSI